MSVSPSPRWLTTEQVAEMIQVEARTVREYCRKGLLDSTRLPGGTELRIPAQAVVEMMQPANPVVDIERHRRVSRSKQRREAS